MDRAILRGRARRKAELKLRQINKATTCLIAILLPCVGGCNPWPWVNPLDPDRCTIPCAGGSLLDSSPFAVSAATSAQDWPTIAHDDGQFFLAWNDARNGPFQIYGTRLIP